MNRADLYFQISIVWIAIVAAIMLAVVMLED
jgi:hypothetical protein